MKTLLIFFLFLSSKNAFADDVHNFYFQKAQGPTTVIQGGENRPVEQAAPTSLAVPVQTSPVVVSKNSGIEVSEPIEVHKWSMHFGLVSNVDTMKKASGQSIGVHYNPSNVWGFEFEILRTKPSVILEGDIEEASFFDANFGVSYVPIKFQVAKIDFRVPFLAGILTTRELKPYCDSYELEGSSSPCYAGYLEMRERIVLPFVGFGLEAHLSERISFFAKWKITGKSLLDITDQLDANILDHNWTGVTTMALNYYF